MSKIFSLDSSGFTTCFFDLNYLCSVSLSYVVKHKKSPLAHLY